MKAMRMSVVGAAALAVVVGVAGCAHDDPHRRAKTGAVVGAVTGAVLGHQLDGDHGRFIGAAVGALAGAAVGNYMDKQQRELEAQLGSDEVTIERLDDDTLKLNLRSEVLFDFDSDAIKPAFYETLETLGRVIVRYEQTAVHVVGHTDSTGSVAYNMRLSERRAESVASHLRRSGVESWRMQTEGRGPHEPRADNATEAGRQLNRRVEIYLRPIVEGQEQEAFAPPRYR